ncbi:MAG: hypothetical protein NUV68_01130 [Caldiserica bacterium]|jgi:hypothetical protein|nr:hypothetical protein [Caldisericota bacterium]MDH7561960.1 hypothetical protein [Caldisericota bacterium]
MEKKLKFLKNALWFSIFICLIFAGLFFYTLFSPKPLVLEGITGTMVSQLDLIAKNLEIFQNSPSMENFSILNITVSRAYGITLPAYAAYLKIDPRFAEKWQDLGVLLNRLELILKNAMVKEGEAGEKLEEVAQELKTLNEPFSQLAQKLRDWEKELSDDGKASLFWSQVEDCEKAIELLGD